MAARRGRVDAARLLLDKGATVELRNSVGEMALHHAADCTVNPQECIKLIVEECLKRSAIGNMLNAMVSIKNDQEHRIQSDPDLCWIQ